jgi:elongation factor G
MKTLHTTHGGKLSIAPRAVGVGRDGAELVGPDGRPAGLRRLPHHGPAGHQARSGRGRRDGRARQARRRAHRHDARRRQGAPPQVATLAAPDPVLATAVASAERKDEVKLSSALAKALEEDPSLASSTARTPARRCRGAGRDAPARRARAAHRQVRHRRQDARRRRSPTRRRSAARSACAAATRSSPAATASSATSCSSIKPLPRGTGFQFSEEITGGVGARNYFSSVEEGVRGVSGQGAARLPGGRYRGDAHRRLVSQRRFVRHGVPHGGADRHARGHAGVQAGAARAGA